MNRNSDTCDVKPEEHRYMATAYIGATDIDALVENLARAMRVENGKLNEDGEHPLLVPVAYESFRRCVRLVIACHYPDIDSIASTGEGTKPTEGKAESCVRYDEHETGESVGNEPRRSEREEDGSQEGAETERRLRVLADHLKGLLGADSVDVAPLYCSAHRPVDLVCLEKFGRVSKKVGGWRRPASEYPTADELRGGVSSSKKRGGAQLKEPCPYISAVLRTRIPAEDFNATLYANLFTSCFSMLKVKIAPVAYYPVGDGLYEIQAVLISENASLDLNQIGEALASQLECDVETRRYMPAFGRGGEAAKVARAVKLLNRLESVDAGDFLETTEEEFDAEEAELAEANELVPVTGTVKATATTSAAANEETEPTGFDKLERLVGMESVKREIRDYVLSAQACQARGKPLPSMHLVLYGNPGTGKTTVARIIHQILCESGLAKQKGAFVEGDRETLVDGYIGLTQTKTLGAIRKARGGVLFIDEAYSLVPEDPGRDFGLEAIQTLVKQMEDNRCDPRKGFTLIMAGYPRLMERMLSANPGLRNRFGYHLYLPDYSACELMEIFEGMVAQAGFELDARARELASDAFARAVEHKGEDFSNGRLARLLLERSQIRMLRIGPDVQTIDEAVLRSVLEAPDMVRSFGQGGDEPDTAPMGLLK